MALRTVKSIGTALSLVDSKKENLKKAFQDLQSHPSLLSSLKFTWPDLDSYFTSVQLELQDKFSVLQSLAQNPETDGKKESFSANSVPARPELKSLCDNMDGLGLRGYVFDRPKERAAVRIELADAFKHAPDPGMMVLDALEGFFDENLPSGPQMRRVCVVLLEELMSAEVEIGPEARERARSVAAEWKAKFPAAPGGDDDKEEKGGGLERLGYLQLLASYKLFNDGGYDVNELIDYAVLGAQCRQAVDLYRILGFGNRISDVIQRLISKGKQIVALKFIFEFGLTHEFPPVPLLKSYVMDAKKIVQKVRKRGKNSPQSLNDAAVKEISALKSAIKCIEDHGLESQYPKDTLQSRIESLEKEKAGRKRPAAATVPKSQHQQVKQQKQNGNKRMKAAAGPSASKRKTPVNSVVTPLPHASAKRSGLFPLPDNAVPYVGPPVGTYGIAGSLGTAVASYMGPPAGLYGLSAAPPGFSENLNPAASNPHPPETHAQPIYYDRAMAYGGYDVPPQYHPVYYPQ